jgi:hypothetical protein
LKDNMSTPARKSAHVYLEELQRAAYARLGAEPPMFDPTKFLSLKKGNLEALRDGGPFDRDLAQAGLDPAVRLALLRQLRQAEEQVPDEVYQQVASQFHEAPTPYENPTVHAILRSTQATLLAAAGRYPEMRLEELSERVTLGTLPTGDWNARTLLVPKTDEYLIVFDPPFFDFFRHFTNATSGPLLLASEYTEHGPTTLNQVLERLRAALREDPIPAERFTLTLVSFLRWGRPFLEYPLPVPISSFADVLRTSLTTFILAHEYGHILLRHLKEAERWTGSDVQVWWRDFRHYDQELEADRIGCDLAQAALAARECPHPYRFVGMDLFFLAVMLTELGLAALNEGNFKRIVDLFPVGEPPRPNDALYPRPAVRYGKAHGWIKLSCSEADFRTIDDVSALTLGVAEELWRSAQSLLSAFHRDGVKPATVWEGHFFGNPVQTPAAPGQSASAQPLPG